MGIKLFFSFCLLTASTTSSFTATGKYIWAHYSLCQIKINAQLVIDINSPASRCITATSKHVCMLNNYMYTIVMMGVAGDR